MDSFIGDEGATVVADALRKNYTVKSLDMRGCNVRSDGAGAKETYMHTGTAPALPDVFLNADICSRAG